MPVDVPVRQFTDNVNALQIKFLETFDSRPDIRYYVPVWHRRARKTTLFLNLLIRECVRYKSRSYAYVGPTQRGAKRLVVREPRMLPSYLPPEPILRRANEAELFWEFASGSVLYVLGADTEDDIDKARGLGCHGWVLDEFSVIRNGEYLLKNIVTPVIMENDGWVAMPFTPKGRNHAYGVFDRATKLGHGPQWWGDYQPVSKSGLLPSDKIAQLKEDLTQDEYAQEYECQFLVGGGGVIKRAREAIAGEFMPPQSGGRYVLGVDLAKKQDWTVLTVLNRDTRHVDAFERFNQIDWSFQVERIQALARKYNNALVILDATGVGDPILDYLRRENTAVRPFVFTSKSKQELVRKLIIAVEQRYVTYPEIEVMVQELEDYDIDERGRYNAPQGLFDDCVMSLALAVHGLAGEVYGAKTPEQEREERRTAWEEEQISEEYRRRATDPFWT